MFYNPGKFLSKFRAVKFMKSYKIQNSKHINFNRNYCTKPNVTQSELPKWLLDQGFTIGLFLGKFEEALIFPYPVKTTVHDSTLKDFCANISKLLEAVTDPSQFEQTEKIIDILEQLRDMKVYSLLVPKELGGMGFNHEEIARVYTTIGFYDLTLSGMLIAHCAGCLRAIMRFGSKEQKDKYVPKLIQEKGQFGCLCLTEEHAGSDIMALKATAIRHDDGSFTLNGVKTWVTNGAIGTIMIVFARVEDKAKTGDEGKPVSAFIVERSFGGVTSGPTIHTMGFRAANICNIEFKDVKVPAENLIGQIGQGIEIGMGILNGGRYATIAVLAGSMRAQLQNAVRFATQRQQFGTTIDNLGAVQDKLSEMTLLHYVAESVCFMVAGSMDRQSDIYFLEAIIGKVMASKFLWRVCNVTMTLHASKGYVRFVKTERTLRNMHAYMSMDRTNDVLRLYIALCGIQYVGEHDEIIKDVFKSPSTSNMGFIINTMKAPFIEKHHATFEPTIRHLVHPDMFNEAQDIVRLSNRFGSVVDKLIFDRGEDLIVQQFLLIRLANAAIDIFSVASVMSRLTYSYFNYMPSVDSEKILTKAWCNQSLGRIESELNRLESDKHWNDVVKFRMISRAAVQADGAVSTSPLGF